MLAYSRMKIRPQVDTRTRTAGCPCFEAAAKARTAGIEIGGAGVAEWNKTNNAIVQTIEEIKAWKAETVAAVNKRAADKTFAPKCVSGADVRECMKPQEIETNRWIQDTWDPWVAEWNKLVAKAVTGVPWGNDDELRDYQRKLINLRALFEDRSGVKFKVKLPPWTPDRGFLEALGDSDLGLPNLGIKLDIPWTGIAVTAGVLGAILLLRK